MIFSLIDPLYFFLALCFGIFIVYVSSPIPDLIVKYPTVENAGRITYKDENDVCYRYIAKEVQCPEDKSRIKESFDAIGPMPKHEEKSVIYNLIGRAKMLMQPTTT